MADDQWLLKEDGYLNIDTESTNIVYHSTLNVILVFTRNNEVKVLDINSGVILQSCRLSGQFVRDASGIGGVGGHQMRIFWCPYDMAPYWRTVHLSYF